MSGPTAGEDDPAVVGRQLLHAAATASLGTIGHDGGWPYASLVLVAADDDATPILLLSDLAAHSQNIAADDRVSLLIDGTAGLDDPLTGPRLTILGRAARSDDPRHRERYRARHATAESYAGFGDFAFYRVAVQNAHLVAGFGRIHAITGDALLGRA